MDIVIYRNKNKEVYEINEELHKEIFNNSNDLSNLVYLKRISDYYKTNVVFKSNEIIDFVCDLKLYKRSVADKYVRDLDLLISKLEDNNILKIHIAGD